MKATQKTIGKILVSIMQFGIFGSSFTPFNIKDRRLIVEYMENEDLISFSGVPILTEKGKELAMNYISYSK